MMEKPKAIYLLPFGWRPITKQFEKIPICQFRALVGGITRTAGEARSINFSEKLRAIPGHDTSQAPNGEVEGRAVFEAPNEGALSKTSTCSGPHRSYPRAPSNDC